MITLKTLEKWLTAPSETEKLEFKEAKRQFDNTKLLQYCAAIANERGGYLVFGVTNKPPRQIVGTHAFETPPGVDTIKSRIREKLHIRVDVVELDHPDGRVLVFDIPSRPIGHPLDLDGVYLMRSGESLVPMTPDHLKRIFAEGESDWFEQSAKENVSPDEVVFLLDTQTFFDMLNQPYPTTREGVLERLKIERLVEQAPGGWNITNLAAILLAKRLDAFHPTLARKAPRVVIYEGIDKLNTREDKPGNKGYAVGFGGLVDFVHSAAPQNKFVEQVVREEVKMFPKQALRELIANALVHQDYTASGTSVMIEMYEDRIEVSNPGRPPISVDRFIDEYRSCNERVADLMRRLGICEEKGSGIDKVVSAAELYQLPAPNFREGAERTIAILYAYKDFSDMSKEDRIRACYQHCVLMYVTNRRMSNQSLRERFGLPDKKAKMVATSQIIAATKEAGWIKPDTSESTSTRYARYLPAWA